MRKLLASTAILAALSTPAPADTVNLQVIVDGTHQFITQFTGPFYNLVFDGWQLGLGYDAGGYEVNAIGSTPHSVEVIMTAYDRTLPYHGPAALQIYPRTLPLGWDETVSFLIDQNNHATQDGGTTLRSVSFTGATPYPGDVTSYTNVFLTDPYSSTADFKITAKPYVNPPGVPYGQPILEATTDVNFGRPSYEHHVPAPIVGAGVPGLISALGGLIFLARRRRRHA